MIGPSIALALGTLVSEDLSCVAAGLLVADGRLGIAWALAACFVGILAGDLGLFAAGRLAGRSILRLPGLKRIAPSSLDRASSWLEQRGAFVILLSRFSPGLRLPVYLAAGLTRVRLRQVTLWFAVACALWVPLLVGSAALFGSAVAHRLPLLGLVAAILLAAAKLRDRAARLSVQVFFSRVLQWEFWPIWAAYLPLVPYLLLLACRYRSATVFTATNPGILAGGLAGESKWDILQRLSAAGTLIAHSELVSASYTAPSFPIVLKPDVGERGQGVAIIRSMDEMHRYLASASRRIIAQEYVPGLEFGVFYCRYPGDQRGRILSITEKRLPELIGDGRSTVRELILKDRRAVILASVYLRNVQRDPESVPPAGERVPLTEIGAHSRGAIFTDASHLITRELEVAIEAISRTHPGFYFGRYDLRVESREALRAGRGFKVLELNGVGAEPTHIYDPSISVITKYRILAAHWRTAFAIGAIHRARGVTVPTLRRLWREVGPKAA
jgi:membrane protein DedA with SNARE-associated domain